MPLERLSNFRPFEFALKVSGDRTLFMNLVSLLTVHTRLTGSVSSGTGWVAEGGG